MYFMHKKCEKYILPSLKVLHEGDISINRLQFDIEIMLGDVWVVDGLPSSLAT